jgi:hypothetical protein
MIKFLETFLRFLAYTIAFVAGKRSAEAENNKATLEEITDLVTEREKSRAKFIDHKRRLPDFTE